MQTDRAHIVFINQYYHPDLAATGQLLTQLTASLSRDFDVTVLTAFPSYSVRQRRGWCLWSCERHSGVEVLRVFSTTFSRRFLPLRAMNYMSFFCSALIAAFFVRRPRVTVVQTDPPFIGLVGLWLRCWRGGRLAIVFQDVFPEVAVVLGKLSVLSIGVLRAVRRMLLRGCDGSVVISEKMRQRLLERGAEARRLRVIANWMDDKLVRPLPRQNAFRETHDLCGKFVVMHSGNVGLSQDFNVILDAAWYLSGHREIVFVVVGDGAQRAWLETQVRLRSLMNIRLVAYQPIEALAESLGAADVHLVTLKPGLEGFIVPSKIFGIMAAARGFIGVAAEKSEIHEIIDKFSCGVLCPPASPKRLAQHILALQAKPELLRDMGERGRAALSEYYSRESAARQYKDWLLELLSESGEGK